MTRDGRMPFWPRLMRRRLAALYCDLSEAAFEREVVAGRLPMPVSLAGQDHWCRVGLDQALDRLTGRAPASWEQEQPGLA